MTPVDIEQARSVAVRAAEAAGALLREAATKDFTVRIKDTSGDVVTELDLAAERRLVGHIRDSFPRHRIIAEESGVGIALCKNKVPVLGVVHDPVAGQTWSAVAGHAARTAQRYARPISVPLMGSR